MKHLLKLPTLWLTLATAFTLPLLIIHISRITDDITAISEQNDQRALNATKFKKWAPIDENGDIFCHITNDADLTCLNILEKDAGTFIRYVFHDLIVKESLIYKKIEGSENLYTTYVDANGDGFPNLIAKTKLSLEEGATPELPTDNIAIPPPQLP